MSLYCNYRVPLEVRKGANPSEYLTHLWYAFLGLGRDNEHVAYLEALTARELRLLVDGYELAQCEHLPAMWTLGWLERPEPRPADESAPVGPAVFRKAFIDSLEAWQLVAFYAMLKQLAD